MSRPVSWVLVRVVAALALVAVGGAGCTSEPEPPPTSRPPASQSPVDPAPTEQADPEPTEPAPTEQAPSEQAPASAPTPAPGDPCDPADGLPDCVDVWGEGAYRYVVGYADCVATISSAPELCTDLDEDGHAGYPDE